MKLAMYLSALGLLLAAGCATAQPVYRNVEANGRISFSDQPSASPGSRLINTGSSVAPPDDAAASLPYELRQIAGRYPVALHTGNDCAPCVAGRSLLIARGVPFTERTVMTAEDSEALQRLSGQTSLPLLSIGTQQLKGFSEAEWSHYLSAAGYPKSTVLPASYRNAPAVPLVTLQAAPAKARAALPAAGTIPGQPSLRAPNPDNLAGIRF